MERVVHPCADEMGGPTTGYMIHCPACRHGHEFNTVPGPNGVGGQKPCWTFDGDLDRPTFAPSMLVTTVRYTAKGIADFDAWQAAGFPHGQGGFESEPLVCHSYVRDGQIIFLSDCSHELAGQTVPLQPW